MLNLENGIEKRTVFMTTQDFIDKIISDYLNMNFCLFDNEELEETSSRFFIELNVSSSSLSNTDIEKIRDMQEGFLSIELDFTEKILSCMAIENLIEDGLYIIEV